MKRALLISAAVVVVMIAAVVIFVATFNINTYKGALAAQLERAVGNPVEIGGLSLAWRGGPFLSVDRFAVLAEQPGGEKVPVLSFDRASASIGLAGLLTRHLEISSISVENPRLTVIRTAEGKILLRGYDPKPAAGPVPSKTGPESSAAKAGAAAAAAFGFNINAIEVKNGTARFIDHTSSPTADIIIKKLDATVRNVSLAAPVDFAVKAALAGNEQNIEASGAVGGFTAGNIFLKDFSLRTDLAAFGRAELLKALPALAKMGLGEGLAGTLTAKIGDLRMAGNKISSLAGDVTFTGGRLALAQLRAPIENINLNASAEGSSITVKSFSATLANGLLKGAAKIDNAFTAPRTAFAITAEARGLSAFLSSAFTFYLNLDGNARIDFKGSMTGSAWPEISRTLVGGGKLSLENGVIANSNMINDTLGALTLFPDLLNSVRGNVPAPVKQVMVERYTPLRPFKQDFTVEGGYIILPELVLASNDMDMQGTGKMSFTGDLSGSGMIRFSPAISGAIIAAVPQMRAIADSQGLVTFPVAFKGGGGAFKVIPDTKYIGQRVAIQAAGDVVSGYLQKAAEAQKGAAGQETTQGPALLSGKAPKIKDLLKAFAEQSQK